MHPILTLEIIAEIPLNDQLLIILLKHTMPQAPLLPFFSLNTKTPQDRVEHKVITNLLPETIRSEERRVFRHVYYIEEIQRANLVNYLMYAQ